MTLAFMDMPNDLLTNTYTLHGFEEFSYIVFIVARPPNNVPGQQEILQESDLSRLKNAEKDFRTVSILVSLDVEKGELFTFYRKSYITKDHKELISKFGPVIRRNCCIISYKTQGPIAHLLKPEQSRVHGLFVRAILSSVQGVFQKGEGKISLGPRALLASENVKLPELLPEATGRSSKVWRYCVLDVQVLATGKILITTTVQDIGLVRLSPDFLANTSAQHSSNPIPLTLCLAPIGQMARHDGGWFGRLPLLTETVIDSEIDSPARKLDVLEQARQETWTKKLIFWLEELNFTQITWENQIWIEVEIPIAPVHEYSNDSSSVTSVEWKRILWPTSLCFSINAGIEQLKLEDHSHRTLDDPWEFIQRWFETAEDRASVISRKESSKRKARAKPAHRLDSEDSDDEFRLDSTPHFPNLGPPDFPPSQLIYPTPPDVALTQATPGMSSMDGIDMTPANLTRNVPDLSEDVLDEDMTELDNSQAVGVGSGFYDEDLFEEMPSDKFGDSGVADEPNWDFFDQPDLEMPDGDDPEDSNNDQAQNIDETIRKSESRSSPGRLADMNILSSDLAHELDSRGLNSSEINHEGREDQDVFDSWARNSGDGNETSHPPQVDQDPIKDADGEEEMDFALTGETPPKNVSIENQLEAASYAHTGRRRSSYESVPIDWNNIRHDARYKADGKYWFDATDDVARRKQPSPSHELPFVSWRGFDDLRPQTPSSSASGSASSSNESVYQISDLRNSTVEGKHTWTEYTPVLPEGDASRPDSSDLQKIEDEANQLLKILPIEIFDLPIAEDVIAMTKFRAKGIYDDVEDITTVAQLLVDQVSQSSFQGRFEDVFLLQRQTLEEANASIDFCEHDSEWQRLSLESFSLLAVPESKIGATRIDELDDFRISLTRAEKSLEALPTIVQFWETLNLQPKAASKNVTVYCIHPTGLNAENGCEAFLARMSEVYVNCSLGNHNIGKIAGTTDNGLLGWSSGDGLIASLLQTCEHLGKALAQVSMPKGNFLVYMINPSAELSSYTVLCNAFYFLFSEYLKTSGKQKPIDIAFQIVPMSFIALPDTITVPTQTEYLKLALEVYNRCPPIEVEDQLAFCGSAVTLAESWNKNVDFDLDINPTSPLAKSGKCLHVAYSQSLDKRWITAAWTDECGYIALTMSYCLRSRTSSSSRPRSEVIQDIWEVSQDLMAKHRSKWRLIVAKDSYYEVEEIKDWLFFANGKNNGKQSTCSIVLISVELHPLLILQIPPPSVKALQGAMPPQPGNTAGTPVSTPQAASTTSPEQLMAATPTPTPGGSAPVNAATPPDHSFDPTTDTDLVLSDPAEQSWSVILSHGLNQSRNVLDVRPAMCSGYLLKRRGAKDDDGVVSLGVNLIYTSIPVQDQTAREDLLKEIITQYRGLVVLAVTRDCLVHREKEVVPWHVATAVKGARILGLVM